MRLGWGKAVRRWERHTCHMPGKRNGKEQQTRSNTSICTLCVQQTMKLYVSWIMPFIYVDE